MPTELQKDQAAAAAPHPPSPVAESSEAASPSSGAMTTATATAATNLPPNKNAAAAKQRRERRERQPQHEGMFGGWENGPGMWDYGHGGYHYEMDPMLMGPFMDHGAMEAAVAMGMDPFMAMDPSMGMFGPPPPHMLGMPPMGLAMGLPPAPSKEGTDGLSIHAKPWTPSAATATAAAPPAKNNKVDIARASWVKTEVVSHTSMDAPAPIMPKNYEVNPFEHSFVILSNEEPHVELEVYNYKCARCPLRTLFGRLSSRKADLTIANVAHDIPPVCLAHLLEQVTKTRVVALVPSDHSDARHYDLWLEKTSACSAFISALNGMLWTCPMFHGFAVAAKNEKAQAFMKEYLKQLQDMPESDTSLYPLTFVEAKEH